jgi:hypothetical protein
MPVWVWGEIMTKRNCDGCIKCCEGYLYGEVNGKKFFRGRPCFYLNKACTIYEDRPEYPCRSYYCAWVESDEFPQWMKPELVNVIITRKKTKKSGIEFYHVVEAGAIMPSKVLSWILEWAVTNKKNLQYMIEGSFSYLGSQEFNKEIRELQE